MEGWGDWDERKEGRKDGEVRDDIDTRMERRGGLDGGRSGERHVTLSAGHVTGKEKGTAGRKKYK